MVTPGHAVLDQRHILVDLRGERGHQHAVLGIDLDVGERLVAAFPVRADVLAEAGAGIFHGYFIAQLQRSVRDGVFREAFVGEPAVQRAHPAGFRAVAELTDAADAADIAFLRTNDLVARAVHRLRDAGHHGGVLSQVDIQVRPGAVPRRLFIAGGFHRRRPGLVLGDHVDTAKDRRLLGCGDICGLFRFRGLHLRLRGSLGSSRKLRRGVLRCGQRGSGQQAQQHHQHKQQRQDFLLHLLWFLLIFPEHAPSLTKNRRFQREISGKRRTKPSPCPMQQEIARRCTYHTRP